jgi:hypothetical protein
MKATYGVLPVPSEPFWLRKKGTEMYHDGCLDQAEQSLSSGNQGAAFKAFEDAVYNPWFVKGGAEEVFARGLRMRPKVTGRYETKWDACLTRVEASVARVTVGQGTNPPQPQVPHPSVGATSASSVDGASGAPHLQAQNMKNCPDCAERVQAEARKCRFCSFEFVKNCPDCAEEVRAEARKCRHCGFRFAAAVSKSEAA